VQVFPAFLAIFEAKKKKKPSGTTQHLGICLGIALSGAPFDS
jgi:hypothetical protein